MYNFIAFDGIDGSGKTTIIERIKNDYPNFVYVRDPGGTNVGNKIRNLLLDKESGNIFPESELYLYLSSRFQLQKEIIKPSLNINNVISDRCFLSTFAYQGILTCFTDEDLYEIITKNFIIPNYIIYMKVCLEDIKFRFSDKNDRIESKGNDFFIKVLERYNFFMKFFKNRLVSTTFYEIDASKSIDNVYCNVNNILKTIL